MKLENMMIEAIKEFKRAKIGEIRNVKALETGGYDDKYDYALFEINYVINWNDYYKTALVRVSKSGAYLEIE